MKDINEIVNESTEINEGYESFSADLRKAGVPDKVILAIYDNRSNDGKISERCLCAVLKEIYKNK